MNHHIRRAAQTTRHVFRLPCVFYARRLVTTRYAVIDSRTRSLLRPYTTSCTMDRSGMSATITDKNLAPPVKVYPKTFNKLLVANRGEIACRIIKTARKMGIRTVAVYSDLDVNALHVQMADEAVHIGGGQAADSYLSIPHILEAVRQTGAQAVHPGYGFLSENPAFVETLEKEGVTFVGPTAKAIAAMGDKIQSKLLAKSSKVHCIPGFDGQIHSVAEAAKVAHEIGYPVMIKASAGGGGKGMRIAWNDSELADGFKLAKQESRSAFGDDRLLIEKYIDNPRHIEVQVLGDKFGNVIYLPERECSIQRRNQKVIEESPSVYVDEETRRRMGEQAVALAKHVGYNSAGTVEFLMDSSRNFYFLEMNTRLQVEHPVTENVTQLDLVEHMLYSAAGYPLKLQQSDIKIHGWSIESRVYAEDPQKYLPSVGRLLTYQEPSTLARCDSGFVEGSEIYVEYDPLICKVVTHGDSRQEAVDSMIRALDEYVIQGVTHNIPLLRSVLAHPRFQKGTHITTHFLAEEYPNGYTTAPMSKEAVFELAAASSALWAIQQRKRFTSGHASLNAWDVWVRSTDEQSNKTRKTKLTLCYLPDGRFEALSPEFGKLCFSTQWHENDLLAYSSFDNDRKSVMQYLDVLDFGFRIQYQGTKYKVAVLDNDQYELSKYMKRKAVDEENKLMISPMPGRIISIAVKEGDEVIKGGELAVVEAMKMQNILRTSQIGIVKSVHVVPGDIVKAGQVLIEFES